MMLSHNPIVEPFALAHATIVTGDKAGTILRNMTIVVGADGRIEQVAPSIETSIPAEYHYLDGTGKIVMPGLINAHTHLFSQGKPLNPKLATPKGQRMVATFAHSPLGKPYMAATVKHNATTLLESGVTTIRTLGDVGYEVVTLRDQIDAGQILGPRILASGPLMAIPEGHGAPLIALTSGTPEEARTAVAQNLKAGVNAIKIAATGGVTDAQEIGEAGSPQMSVEQMRAICDEAHQYGVIVGAHAQAGRRAAFAAGRRRYHRTRQRARRRIDRHVPAQSECVARILGIDSDTVRRPSPDLAWTGRDRHHRHPIGEFQKRGRRHGFRCSSGARGRIDDRRRHRYRHDIRAAVRHMA